MLELYDLNDEESVIAKKVVCEVLRVKGISADEVDIDITVVDGEAIRVLNRETRGIDKATDVLTFPNVDIELPFNLGDYDEYDLNPETGALILGEIIIAREVMVSNATEYGHSATRECAFLVTHGMLHLLGYDHIDEADRTEMRRNEEEILNNLGLTREV